eukprot:jgi/Psemu1/47166/gm1.47166_g
MRYPSKTDVWGEFPYSRLWKRTLSSNSNKSKNKPPEEDADQPDGGEEDVDRLEEEEEEDADRLEEEEEEDADQLEEEEEEDADRLEEEEEDADEDEED